MPHNDGPLHCKEDGDGNILCDAGDKRLVRLAGDNPADWQRHAVCDSIEAADRLRQSIRNFEDDLKGGDNITFLESGKQVKTTFGCKNLVLDENEQITSYR